MWYSNTAHNSMLIFALIEWLKSNYSLDTPKLALILDKLKDVTDTKKSVLKLGTEFFDLSSIDCVELNFTQQTIKIRWDSICVLLITKP